MPEIEDCSFDNVKTENLNYCPNKDMVGGVAIDFYYAPAAHFEKFEKPAITATTGYEARITIAANSITLKASKGWKKITMLVDESELKNTLVGNKGNKKPKVEFDAYIPNFLPRNIGFIDAHMNTPMVWCIPDSTGRKWIIGNPDAPAIFDKGDGTTGKKYEDNSGVGVTVSANTKLYTYLGEVVVLADAPATT